MKKKNDFYEKLASEQKNKEKAQKSKFRSKPKLNKININIFGTHAVTEAWLNPKRNINALYLTEKSYPNFEPLIHKARKLGINRPEAKIVEKNIIDISLNADTVHQGIAINAQLLPEIDISDIIHKETKSDRDVILILDQVTDPHNVGAIIRSACALGAKGIIMQKKHAPELKGVLAKIACGALDHLDIAMETNLSRSIEKLQNHGYFVLGLDERGAENIGDINMSDKIALILGAEGSGMRALLKDKCDNLVKLPTNIPIASLNVSNAAAISLYAVLND